MKHLLEFIGIHVVVIGWLAGVVLAKGFGATVVAIFLPPYAWYLTVERAMQAAGLI